MPDSSSTATYGLKSLPRSGTGVALWLLAAFLVWVTASRAMSAEPDIDAMLETATYDDTCTSTSNQHDDYSTGACRTDNVDVTYFMDDFEDYALETDDRNAVRAAMSDLYLPTDLTITYDNTPVFSGAGETDIVYEEGGTNLPSEYLGITWCNDSENGASHLCDQHYVMIRVGDYTKKSAGHETGHAVGLAHPSMAYPTSGSCATKFHIMREADSCQDVELGTMLTNNINWVF